MIGQQRRLVGNENLEDKNPKLFSGFLKVTGENSTILKNVFKGCEYSCGGKKDMVTCPPCNRFKYHMDCLKKMFEIRKKALPNFDEEKWNCPHCPE